MNSLTGKVAVITGGTRGFGLSIARSFALAGASVVVASRNQDSVDDAVRLIKSIGGQASGLVVDVANINQVQALADHAISTFGKLDIWVNNAGIAGPYGPTTDFCPEDFHQVIQTNILGVYHGSRTAMQIFLAQKAGKLINILGYGYNRLSPFQNAYGSSKAWIKVFTLSLAKETQDSGVGVFAFNPGMVLTELLTNLEVIEGSENRLKVYPTVVRILAKSPEIPAEKMVWIASSATDGKTGKLYRTSSYGQMTRAALKEVLRRLLRKPAPDSVIQVKTIPPYRS